MPDRLKDLYSNDPHFHSHDPMPDPIRDRDKAALAAALDPIVTIDAKGLIQSVSDSVQRVLGWTPAELIGKNVSVLMPEPHRSGHDGYLANYHRTGATNIMNRPRRFDAQRKDGTTLPIELCVSRADVPGSHEPLFVGIIRDMSAVAAAEHSREQERANSQQQLAQQTAALQSAHLRLRMADRMASIGTLAAGLGHDMNNVLLPVRARLNALKAAGDSGRLIAGDAVHVDEIRKSVAYLQQLADGLHFLSLDPDTHEDARGGGASTDLVDWWSKVGTLLSKAVPKHVLVQAAFPDNLPRVAIAAHGLTQAVFNLVVNAGEAIPGPEKRKRRQGIVRVRAQRLEDSSRVRLSVADNGSGMAPEVRQRAFEMFYTTKPRGMGTGLGLALVRKVVQRAKGKIEIDSEPGMGTTVILDLLAAPESVANAPQSTATISIADPRAASLVRIILESSGLATRTDPEPADSHLWIVDPGSTTYKRAANWLSDHPKASLVLFGRPDPQDVPLWEELDVVMITEVADFEGIRSTLARVLAEKNLEN